MHIDHEKASKKVKQILLLVLVLNLLVMTIKFIIGFKSGSMSIIGDAVHSSIDGLNNIVALVMIKLASEPPDEDHPYGHGKFETLGALAVVAFLALASFELIEKSVMRFFNPGDLPHITSEVFYMLLATLVINIFVWLYEYKQGIKLQSQLLIADAKHTFSDILVTISILASVFFITQGHLWLDAALGLLIAAVIMRSGWMILSDIIPVLVDEAWIKIDDVKEMILASPKVASLADFKSRKSSKGNYLEMTIRFATDSLQEAHDLSHQIEDKIIEKFGHAEILIHIEPSKNMT
jgi:cation diffusion facilitator family transporter